jgi:hypothetical protein
MTSGGSFFEHTAFPKYGHVYSHRIFEVPTKPVRGYILKLLNTTYSGIYFYF